MTFAVRSSIILRYYYQADALGHQVGAASQSLKVGGKRRVQFYAGQAGQVMSESKSARFQKQTNSYIGL